jgi:hypothetical protein
VSLVVGAPPEAEKPYTPKELAEHVAAVQKDARPAAKDALKTFELLATKDNVESLGFKSLDEVKGAELGPPLVVVLVELKELREYQKGGDPYKLLHPIHRVIFPVTVKGEVRSGLELHKKDGKWESTSFGLAGAVRLYAQARERHADKGKEADYFLVKVPALNEVYLAHQEANKLLLVHVRAQAEKKEKLAARPAAEVFEELVPEAKKHDGKAR